MIYFVGKLPKRFESFDFDRVVLFAHEFLELPENLELEIEFVALPKNMQGEADYEDELATISLNSRIKKSELIPTIFHEMVHIKQIINKDLIIGVGNKRTKWKGKHFQGDYYDFPWEVEAFKLEEDMMNLFEEKKNGLPNPS